MIKTRAVVASLSAVTQVNKFRGTSEYSEYYFRIKPWWFGVTGMGEEIFRGWYTLMTIDFLNAFWRNIALMLLFNRIMWSVNRCQKLSWTNANWGTRHFPRLCSGSQDRQKRSCSQHLLEGFFLLFVTTSSELKLVFGTLYLINFCWMDGWMCKLPNPYTSKISTIQIIILLGTVWATKNMQGMLWVIKRRSAHIGLLGKEREDDTCDEPSVMTWTWTGGHGREGQPLWSGSYKLLS